MASAEFLAPLADDERAKQQTSGAEAAPTGDAGHSFEVPADPADALALVQRAQDWRLSRSGCLSARLDTVQLQRCCALRYGSRALLEHSAEELTLSGRGMHRLLSLARTIADLAGSEHIEPPHLTEAVELRRPIEKACCNGG